MPEGPVSRSTPCWPTCAGRWTPEPSSGTAGGADRGALDVALVAQGVEPRGQAVGGAVVGQDLEGGLLVGPVRRWPPRWTTSPGPVTAGGPVGRPVSPGSKPRPAGG